MSEEYQHGGATPVGKQKCALDMAKAIAAPRPMIYVMLNWPDDHNRVVWAEDPVNRRRHYAASPRTWNRVRDVLMLDSNRDIDDAPVQVIKVGGPVVRIEMLERWTTEVLGADPPDPERPVEPHTLILTPDGPRW